LAKPDLDFQVLKWADAFYVLDVLIFGTDHRGRQVSTIVSWPASAPCSIAGVNEMVAKMNNGEYRE